MPDNCTSQKDGAERSYDFEYLATKRKLLREFCPKHVQSLAVFYSEQEKVPIFKLDTDESTPKELRHITSTATCYESIETCPNALLSPQDGRLPNFQRLGQSFAELAIKLPATTKWKSDGKAGIYCSARGLPYVLTQLKQWRPEIDQHLSRIFYQMDQDETRQAIGEADKAEHPEDEVKEKKTWYGPNAYHTYWTLTLLKTLEGGKQFEKGRATSKQFKNAIKRRGQLLQWARQELGVQVALHTAESSKLDSDQLAWAIAIFVSQPEKYQSNLAEQDLLRQAFKCLFSTQEPVGTWRHYAPLFHYPNAGNAYCYVFETFATLLREANQIGAEFAQQELKKYLDQLVRLWEYSVTTQTRVGAAGLAWSSGHRNKPVLESWATASVFAYAQMLRKLIGTWTNQEALKTLSYKPTPPLEEARRTLQERADIWTSNDLADRLWSMFVNPVINKKSRIEPDEPLIENDFPRSAILFGPPGTSKTSLVRALAGAIEWNYIELHPSHFVSEGLPSVQQTADSIFKKLMELDHAVILFDEIDELVRERESEPDQFGRFLTTSMLPRLAELWKGRKVMYFVATNHIEYFDRAVTRSERFDAIIFMSPPSFTAKKKKLEDLLNRHTIPNTASGTRTKHTKIALDPDVTKDIIDKAMPTKRCSALLNANGKGEKEDLGSKPIPRESALAKFALLRWDELSALAFQIEKNLGQENPITKETFKRSLYETRDGKSRTLKDYCKFRTDQSDYERYDLSKNARWFVTEIEGWTESEGDPPPPVRNDGGTNFIDTPLGSIRDIKIPGYQARKTGQGEIQLVKEKK